MASSPDVFASSPEPPSRRTRAPTNTDPIDVIVISSDDEDVAPPPKRSALRLRSKGKGKQRAHGADHVIDVETVTDEPKGTKRKGTNGEGSSSERDTKRAKEVRLISLLGRLSLRGFSWLSICLTLVPSC